MSKFNPTHKTPSGELLHSEAIGGVTKYWTKHAWDVFGDAYSGPVEALDCERFVYRLHGDVDPATGMTANKAALIAKVNQSMSQGQVKVNQVAGNQPAAVSTPSMTQLPLKRDGSSVSLPHGVLVAWSRVSGGWTVANKVNHTLIAANQIETAINSCRRALVTDTLEKDLGLTPQESVDVWLVIKDDHMVAAGSGVSALTQQMNQHVHANSGANLSSVAKIQGTGIVQHGFTTALGMSGTGVTLTMLVVSEVLHHAEEVDDVVEDYVNQLSSSNKAVIKDFVHDPKDPDYTRYQGKVYIYLVEHPSLGYPAHTAAMVQGGFIHHVSLDGRVH